MKVQILRIAHWLGLTNLTNEEIEAYAQREEKRQGIERFGPDAGSLAGLVKAKFRCGVCSRPVEKEGQLCCEIEPERRKEIQKGYPEWDQEPYGIREIEEMQKDKPGYYAGGCSSRALLEWREREKATGIQGVTGIQGITGPRGVEG